MIWRSWFATIIIMLLASCQPLGNRVDESALVEITPTIDEVDSNYIRFTVEDLTIHIQRPNQWEYFTTEYGIVLAESLGNVAVEGEIDGLFTHVWLPPLDDITVPVADSDSQSEAKAILEQIVSNRNYIGDALISELQSFTWDGHDAAYYLMNNGEGNLTIVFGIIPFNSNTFVATSVSAPLEEASRIRAETPALLDQLDIDGVPLSGETLEAILPGTLRFP